MTVFPAGKEGSASDTPPAQSGLVGGGAPDVVRDRVQVERVEVLQARRDLGVGRLHPDPLHRRRDLAAGLDHRDDDDLGVEGAPVGGVLLREADDEVEGVLERRDGRGVRERDAHARDHRRVRSRRRRGERVHAEGDDPRAPCQPRGVLEHRLVLARHPALARLRQAGEPLDPQVGPARRVRQEGLEDEAPVEARGDVRGGEGHGGGHPRPDREDAHVGDAVLRVEPGVAAGEDEERDGEDEAHHGVTTRPGGPARGRSAGTGR